MKSFAAKVEEGVKGENGKPSVGPVYRNLLSEKGFPPIDSDITTAWDIFNKSVEKFPDNKMLGWRTIVDKKVGPYMWKTYKEAYEEVLQVGSALRALGAEPGCRVGIYGINCPQWIVAMEACAAHTLICVPLYDTLGSGAVDYIVDHAEIDFVFVQDTKIKGLLEPDSICAKRLKAIVSFADVSEGDSLKASEIGVKTYSWLDFLRMGREKPEEISPPKPFNTCTIMYTSGTSGEPKGVVLTHEAVATFVVGVDLFMDQFEDKMTHEDVYLSFLPLAHILDRMNEEYFFRKGASIGYYHGDLNVLRDDIQELKPTYLAGVPRVFERIHEGIQKALQELNPRRRFIFNALYKHKLSWLNRGYSHSKASPMADLIAFRKIRDKLGGRIRLLISGGAPLSPEIEEFLRVTCCCFVLQGYGLTETLGGTALCIPDEMCMLGTVGIPAVYNEIRLEEVAEMGYDPLGENPAGEICIRGKCLFSGYYKNPELTDEVLKDGWFHTGDIGEIQPNGVLKIIDRKKNLIKLSQGEYVALENLENIYGQNSVVQDIWVYGDSFKSMLVAVRGPFLSFLACLLVLLFSFSISAITHDHQDIQEYIVYMGSLPARAEYKPMSHHMSILQEAVGESLMDGRLLRSYKRSFNGFAARLTESEREQVAGLEGVVSVFPNKKLKLQTTASWDFMGLKEGKGTKRNPSVESDTIIGVLDGGIWPESESFSDKGFGPPPKKWKGVCAGGNNFTCNNKLIGARHYSPGDARDSSGHGTHTASIAAGNAVPNASFFGLGYGTMRGAVPASRIAAYRVCAGECRDDILLSAFDDAIADGVDIITISVGSIDVCPLEEDPIAIGAFHAMSKGILTVNAAGNTGPNIASVTSLAPWMLTVAASTTNRVFVTKVVLGDGKTLVGKSVNVFDLKGNKFPLVYGKSAASSASNAKCAEDCTPDCLDASLVKGKILVCNISFPYVAYTKGAVAAIVKDGSDWAQMEGLPVSGLEENDFESFLSYINSSNSPEATVLKSETIFNQTAPKVLSFSSRGPNIIVADVLKPDITAPGLEIVAANSLKALPFYDDTTHVKYSVESGTSMSCPHVAGVAAYVKTFHPEWSPSMIKSAIMTTAWPMNASQTDYASTEFAYGSGHVDPIAATNPGLVYDITKADYMAFLCGMNYNATTVRLISGEAVTCSEKILPRDLNYPSMSAKLSGSNISFTVTFNRTVTNVGGSNSTYKSKVVLTHGAKLNVMVSPRVLFMKSVNEKQSFTVTVSGRGLDPEMPSSASLIWSDGTHKVRSPIVIYSGIFRSFSP